jgi:murein DD-endopeptidase MepM/ murein hydrolase activator NlpD
VTTLPKHPAVDLATPAADRAQRALKGRRDQGELVEAARQLEGVFVSMLFDEMAKTVDTEDGLFTSTPGEEMYQSWFRHEVAKQFAASGGTGLGDAIANSLGATVQPRAHAGAAPLPVAGRITSEFGERIHPVTNRRHMHHGVDIAAPVGTPIEVPFAGRVVKVGSEGPMGNHVVVEHANGYRSVYAHASEVLVREGDQVAAGQVLAKVGSTGRSTGPHLHFGLTRDGKPVDPMRWLRPGGGVSVR